MKFSQFNIAIIAILSNWGVMAAEETDALPNGRVVIAGYGNVMYESSNLQDSSSFSAQFNPIMLFRLSDELHIETELEISLDDQGETELELEYAKLHYFINDTITLTAGKFLLAFGQFSQNLHPSWINRSPWTPGIYGSHGSTQAMTPLLPVLSDVGVAVQKTFVFSSKQKIFLDLYVSNGARSEGAAHQEEAEGFEEEHGEEFPEVGFEASNGDNNKDKAVGGRIAYAFLPGLEIGASYYTASYDDDELLDISAKGIDINLMVNHFLIRGEYIQTDTDGLEADGDSIGIHNFKRDGWYLQGIWHLGQLTPALSRMEIVVERARVNKFEKSDRWVYGINYWLDGRSVIKIAYEDTNVVNGKDDKRFAIQFSYGF